MDVIERIEHFDTFDEAVADCVTVGVHGPATLGKDPPRRSERGGAELLDAAPDGPVALVFGREDSGLPNDVLDRVHATVTIPTTNHASLNLAQAALIALYELHLAAADATRTSRRRERTRRRRPTRSSSSSSRTPRSRSR